MNALRTFLASFFCTIRFAKLCRVCALLLFLSLASGCCSGGEESKCGEQCCTGDSSCVDEGTGPVCKTIKDCSLCKEPKVCCSAGTDDQGNSIKKCCAEGSYCADEAPYCMNKKKCLSPKVVCGGKEDPQCCDNCCMLGGFPPQCIGKDDICCDCNGTKKVCNKNQKSSCEACCGS